MSPTTTYGPSVSGSLQHREFEHSATPSHPNQLQYRVQRHHRKTTTGGGRTWTEEEEAYLLRTRLHKTPYKHIAAHLKKTELACRLHYHQMSYGANRRRRTESRSSASSCPSAVGGRDVTPVPSPPSSPEYPAGKPACSPAHAPILPRPDTSPSRSLRSTPVDPAKFLHLDTSCPISQPHKSADNPASIDPARLRAIYDAHRSSFWSMIALEYSRDAAFSGRQLEEAFFQATLPPTTTRAPSPPTPGPSPRDVAPAVYHPSFRVPVFHTTANNRGFHAISNSIPISTTNANTRVSARSPVERCAVSALLTAEEVRPAKELRVNVAV
ncbi:hypothetical protein VTN02DRAFT_4771 [Thermoascus thermophilus]